MSRTASGVTASDFSIGREPRDLETDRKAVERLLSQKFGGVTADTGIQGTDFLTRNDQAELQLYLLNANGVEDLKARLVRVTQDLTELGKFERHYRNIVFQEGAIRRSELPESTKIDVSQLARQAQVYQLGDEVHPHISSVKQRVGVYSNTGVYPSSVVGGTNLARMAVRDNDARDEITSPIGKDKRNLIFDAKRDCLDDIDVARARMKAHFRGEELSPAQERQLRKAPGKARRVTQNLGEFVAASAYNIVDPFLRGTITQGNAKDHELYQEYISKRDALINSHANLINGYQGRNIAYLNMLRQMYARQATMPGYEGMALQLAELDKLIDAQIKEIQGINEKDLAKFNEEINKLNQEMLGKVGGLTKERDEMVKFRILQVLLIMSPLGLFNYMIPIANIFGPLLSASTTMGEGMAAIVTSDVFGPFGWLADAVEVDKVIMFIFDDLPVVSDLGVLIKEVINCAPIQELMGAMSPMATGSPLLPIAIAAVFSIRRFDTEAQHYEKLTAVEEEQMKKIEAEFDKFRKGISKDGVETAMKKFIGSQIAMTAHAQVLSELVDFISKAEEEELAIFDDFKFKCKVGEEPEAEMTLKELATKTNLTPSAALELLKTTSQENRTKMAQMFLVLDSPEVKRDLTKFNAIKASPAQFGKEIKAALEDRTQDVLIDMAEQQLGMRATVRDYRDPSVDEKEKGGLKKKMAEEYKIQLVRHGVDKWKEMDQVLVPDRAPQKQATTVAKPMQPLHLPAAVVGGAAAAA